MPQVKKGLKKISYQPLRMKSNIITWNKTQTNVAMPHLIRMELEFFPSMLINHPVSSQTNAYLAKIWMEYFFPAGKKYSNSNS